MSDHPVTLTVRHPRIDWSDGFPRHWYAGDATATHVFNALSFLFPQGERFFIEAARRVAQETDLSARPELARAVDDFVAQEGAHTKAHLGYNGVLESQGYANVVHDFLEWIIAFSRRFHPLTRLGIVCAYEHYTAVLGDYILSHPHKLDPAPPELALIWGWHSAEESEHKAVCFDLYQEGGGGYLRRGWTFLIVTYDFSVLFGRLYLSMLWRDGLLRPSRLPKTLWQSARFIWGKEGVGWHVLRHAFGYLKPGFHPWERDNRAAMEGWFRSHDEQLETAR